MPKNRHVFDLIYVFSSDPTQRPYYQPLLTDPTEAPYQKTLLKPDPTKLWIPHIYFDVILAFNYFSVFAQSHALAPALPAADPVEEFFSLF